MGALEGTLCFLPVGPDRKSSLLKAKRQSSCRGEDGKNGEPRSPQAAAQSLGETIPERCPSQGQMLSPRARRHYCRLIHLQAVCQSRGIY